MNKVILTGRLTKDPELKYTPKKGTAIATFTLAVDRIFKKEGQPSADFIKCKAFGKLAEAIATYLAKGKFISVSGSIQTSNYTANDNSTRINVDVLINEFEFLEKGSKNKNTNTDSYTESQGEDFIPIDDGEIPF